MAHVYINKPAMGGLIKARSGLENAFQESGFSSHLQVSEWKVFTGSLTHVVV
jgi:hypothetical protein